jgi:prephenate dehydrogenase
MTIRLSIIGLGQIGASIGLALADRKDMFVRLGHDRDRQIARQAEKIGAVDKIVPDLKKAAEEGDLLILSLPVDQLKEAIATAGPVMKEGAILMDTAPVKEAAAGWAREYLPENRHYVGLTPVLNPLYLQEHQSGVGAAHADLFKTGMMVIVAPPTTGSQAVRAAADLARLLGASPMFADPVEVDSLMAATHIVPQLLAAALLNSTVDQPGWQEGRMLAGRAYAEVTGPIVQLGEADALCSSAMLAKANVVRILDSVIASLQSIRGDLVNESGKSLTERLERARNGREQWWNQRQAADWNREEIRPNGEPEKGNDVFSRLTGIGRKQPGK